MSEDNNFNEVDTSATQIYDLKEIASTPEDDTENTISENCENTVADNSSTADNTDSENTAADTSSSETQKPAPVYYPGSSASEPEAQKPEKKKGSTVLLIGMIIVLVAAVILATLLVLISIKKKNGSIPQEASISESFSLLFNGEPTAAPTPAPSDNTSVKPDEMPVINSDGSSTGTAGSTVAEPTPVENSTAVSDETGSGTAADEAPEPTTIPEFNVTTTLGQYKGIEVDYVVEPVSEESVDADVEAFLMDMATLSEVTDRPAQMGDAVVFSCVGFVDNVLNDNCTLSDFEMNLGDGGMIPGFEEGLVGHSAGESFDLPLTFPEDYYEDMAGKDVLFTITLSSVSEYILPELTNELVAENTDYATIEEYRNSIRDNYAIEAVSLADEEAENAIMEKLVESTTFEGEIEEEIEWTTGDLIAYYDEMIQSYYGMTAAELYEAMYGLGEEEFNDMMREQAEYTVKYTHILEQIIIDEGLECTEEEYTEAFEEMFFNAAGYESEEEVYADYSEEEIREYITESILNEKATKVIFDNAVYNGK